MKLICIDATSDYNHISIQNRPSGASEYQLYNLIKHLMHFFDIRCFNNRNDFEILDLVQYDSLKNLHYEPCDIVLVMRFFPTGFHLPKAFKTIIWIHDIPDFNVFLGNDTVKVDYYRNRPKIFKSFIEPILNDKSIIFIANSYHTKEVLLTFIKTHSRIQTYDKCEVIYNIMYSDEFDTSPCEKIPKRLLYASAWQKGIEKIIEVYRHILKQDPEYTLALCSPGYDWEKFKDYANKLQSEFGEKLWIYGPSTRNELSRIIKESMCCLTPIFNETFGCLFAECYFLGTPVIGDIRSGAVREIIGDEHIVDYNSAEKLWETLNISMLEKPHLNDIFLLDTNLQKWKTLIQK